MRWKRWLLLLALVALLVTPTMAVSAKGPKPPKPPRPKPFTLRGTISALADPTITVLVTHGSKEVKPFKGDDLDVETTGETAFFQKTSEGKVELEDPFANLKEGDKVSIAGHYLDEVFTAKTVVVEKPKPVPFLLHGLMMGKDGDADPPTITTHVLRGNRRIKPYVGKTLDVQVGEDTKYFQATEDELVELEGGFDALEEGDLLLIHGRLEDGAFTARRVVVKDLPSVPFSARGTVGEKSADPASFLLTLADTDPPTEITVLVNEETKFFRQDGKRMTRIEFEELMPKDLVLVRGAFAEDEYTAKKVIVLPSEE